jgi:hypothetical protein
VRVTGTNFVRLTGRLDRAEEKSGRVDHMVGEGTWKRPSRRSGHHFDFSRAAGISGVGVPSA